MAAFDKLKEYFIQNFGDFQRIDAPGGSDAANAIVAAALAESIIKAVAEIYNVQFQGEMSCAQINQQQKQQGYVYVTLDSGVLDGANPLTVSKGDVVFYDGGSFVKLFGGMLTVDGAMSGTSQNPVQNRVVKAAIDSEVDAREAADASLSSAISGKENVGVAGSLVNAHAGRTDNPHNVTASQVGADPSGTAANEVSNHNSSGLAHAYLFDAKEDAGTAASAVASHNNSDTAHEGLFTALSDALSTETSERRASDNSLTESLDSLEDDFRLHKYSNNPHPQFTPSVDVSNVTTLAGIQTPLQRGQIIYCTVNIGNTEPTTVLRAGFRSGSRLATFDSVTLRLAYRGGSQVGNVVTFYFGQVFDKKDYQKNFTYNTATATGAWTPINVEEL